MSGLYPIRSVAFYRRHGWDWVGEQKQYVVPTSGAERPLKAGVERFPLSMYEGLRTSGWTKKQAAV